MRKLKYLIFNCHYFYQSSLLYDTWMTETRSLLACADRQTRRTTFWEEWHQGSEMTKIETTHDMAHALPYQECKQYDNVLSWLFYIFSAQKAEGTFHVWLHCVLYTKNGSHCINAVEAQNTSLQESLLLSELCTKHLIPKPFIANSFRHLYK